MTGDSNQKFRVLSKKINSENVKLVSLAGIECEIIKQPVVLPEAYTIDTIYGKITIYNKYYFKIENSYYYQVTSEKNFDFLFE